MDAMSSKHEYYVLFDFGDYTFESVHVYADTKKQVRKLMENQYGKEVRIRRIEKTY